MNLIKNSFKNLPKYYKIFYQTENNNEKIIINNEDYKLSKDILFIHEIAPVDLGQSIFSFNYDKLSESKQDILDEKFSCSICNENIKNEKPLLCYRCQKIFHKKCLENWEKNCFKDNKRFNCPYCKNDLPLKDWKEKINYEEERKNTSEIMKKLNEQENNNINYDKNNGKIINE